MNDVLRISYDPQMLGHAFINQYKSSKEEVHNEFEKLGFKTDEEKAWFQTFSFAFSVARGDSEAPDHLKSVPALPETLKARIRGSHPLNRADLAESTRQTVGSTGRLSDQMIDTIKAFSVLGMAAFSLDAAAMKLSENEDYDEFVCLVFVAREALAMYQLRIKGLERKTLVARANAIKRHQETYMLQNEVVEYWKANIRPSLSNEKAADVLLKTFPLSHRKLKQYVAAAKKNTPC